MIKETNELRLRCGEILSIAVGLEHDLMFFIENYFVMPQTPKTFFFRDAVLFELSFQKKINVFNQICKKEDFSDKKVKSILKSIEHVKKVRNNVAHWSTHSDLEGKVYLENGKSITYPKDRLEVTSEVLDKVRREAQKAREGIMTFYLEYYQNGTFEEKELNEK